MAPKIPQIIKCDSSHHLEHELEYVRHDLSLTETEDTWDKIARAVQYLEALMKGLSQALFSELVSAVKLLARPISNSILSDRSRLSGHAAELVTTLASCLKRAFEPLISSFVPVLLQGCARSNKVFVSKSKACLMAIVEHVQSPHLLPHFRGSVTDKSLSLRLISTELVLACMNCFNPPDLETPQRADDIETVIRATATDASAEVRKCSRAVFEAYKILLPGRLDNFVNPMSPTMKRYLAVTSKEKPSTLSSSTLSSSTSSTRRAEVSATTSSRPALSTSRSTKDLKRSATMTSSSSKTEARPVQHKAVEHTTEAQARKDRPPPTGPVRPPFSSREHAPPAKLATEDKKRSASTSTHAPSQHTQSSSRSISVNLSRPATTAAPVHVSDAIMTSSRTGARRPEPIFKRPASPSKGDVALKSSASRPNSVLAVEDLRKPTEERSTKGPRRVPRPPTPEEQAKGPQNSRSAKLDTSGSKPIANARQGLSRSADADARKDALKAKLDAQKALGVTERRPTKGHTRAASQPANVVVKEKKPEAKNDAKAMPPPPPRSASTSSRPALTAPTLAQLARMKEAASEAKPRPVKTFTKTVKGAKAVIKPLTIRKGKRKSSLKAVATSVTPSAGAETARGEDHDAESERVEPSPAPSEPEGPPHHTDEHDNNVPSPTEDEPTIREIAVLQSLVITPPPDSPESSSSTGSSNSISTDGTTASSFACEMHTPPRALFPTFPLQPAATPISALLFSIERGFVAPTPSHSVLLYSTLPYPDNGHDAEEDSDDEENVLKNVDFAMNGIDSCGKVLQSPRKKGINSENRSPLGNVDTNCT